MPNYILIGLKIKERRQQLGLTQSYVATKLNVNPSHISNIECGRTKPSLSTLIHLANLLECSIDYFVGGEYTFQKEKEPVLDNKIIEKLKNYDFDKKQKILKIMDIL